MKWIVLLLALANAGYFAWQYYVGQPSSSTKAFILDAGNKLVLVNEQSAIVKDDGKATPKATQAVRVGKASNAKACYSVGPFVIIGDVSNAARMFEEAGIAAQQRAAPEKEHAGFWVFIPPQPSLQSARAVLRDLQLKELRDALIISEGEKANAISVGVYYVEQQAEQRRNDIIRMGYAAQIEELTRTRSQYWLDIELQRSTRIPGKLWQQALKKYAGIEHTKRECE